MILRSHLVSLYNTLFMRSVIPQDILLGIIIPVLKKPMLDPNNEGNYRPITIGSTHCKLLEFLIMPVDSASRNQYGFRKARGTGMACSLLNDTVAHFKNTGTPLFICSLDAEKCFDSIWHDGLFAKLYSVIPDSHWSFLYKWYKSMICAVKWDNEISSQFPITRGTKQGSILSPTLFNIFINDLLMKLNNTKEGARMGDIVVNSFAYADDITVLSPTAKGLQRLFDICDEYASEWRFKFGIKKTKCMTINGNVFKSTPTWLLGSQMVENTKQLEILGTVFDENCNYVNHVQTRIQSCRRAMYGLHEKGCCYPGLSSESKIYLWKSIGMPTLLYGLDAVTPNKLSLSRLESCQASLMKRFLGFQQRTHHSNLLAAVNVPNVDIILKRNTRSLFKRIFDVDSPSRDVCAFQLASYVLKGSVIKGTLIEKLVESGDSPIKLLFDRKYCVPYYDHNVNSGVVDSLRYLIMHSNFLKPYSDEHIIASLLVKAF